MDHAGLEALLQRPLLESIWRRRTHRVSQGTTVLAGTMSYQSTNPRAPLSELEEAILIAATGCTGLTMPDRPFQDPTTKREILTEPDHARPAIRDDRNFYRLAGVKRWVKKGFLNKDMPVPLGIIGSLRTQIEADLLLQTIFLTADAMGLGAWIHGAIGPPVILGDPKFIKKYGPMLGFDFATPRWRLADILRWHVLLPSLANLRTNPIGLRHKGEHLIKGMCVFPGYYDSMSEAVDEVVAKKFGPDGIYTDTALFDRIYKGDYGERYLKDAAEYTKDVIDCVKDICNYIYDTHGRFP